MENKIRHPQKMRPRASLGAKMNKRHCLILGETDYLSIKLLPNDSSSLQGPGPRRALPSSAYRAHRRREREAGACGHCVFKCFPLFPVGLPFLPLNCLRVCRLPSRSVWCPLVLGTRPISRSRCEKSAGCFGQERAVALEF